MTQSANPRRGSLPEDPLADAGFQGKLGFRLDPFQQDAIEGLRSGKSVLVAAPTGSGKTVVAEYAAEMALRSGQKLFYTTPLKALSNQKYRDLSALYGIQRVGLLTGDVSVNAEAPVVVMTTEVLRNMLYEGSDRLADLGYVVMDEVHYLQDPYRGGVWEEVIIHLPAGVRLVCLSATVSNSGELGAWIESLQGKVAVVEEEARPVPLHHLFLAEDRASGDLAMLPVFDAEGAEGRPNPSVRRLVARARGRGRRSGVSTPGRIDVVDLLRAERMLPAIYFIFSRAGCDRAVAAVAGSGMRLTSSDEASAIRRIVDDRMEALDGGELAALGFDTWLAALESGVAAHHAGLVPAFKEAVEEAFNRGLVKVVFATETLSLGINMPARSVVIENLSKFNGQFHALLLPGEFTQLCGRAGRRGTDEIGYAISLYSRWVPFERVAEIAAARTYTLRSSFRPTYNMAANLVMTHEREEARKVIQSSFAQFRIDRDLRRLQQEAKRRRKLAADYRARAEGETGEDRRRWDRRRGAVERDMARLERQIERKAGGLVNAFENVLDLLEQLGYYRADWSLTDAGRQLAGIYCERDIVVAETLRNADMSGLSPAELAAAASLFTYEARSEEGGSRLPTAAVGELARAASEGHARVAGLEAARDLPETSEPDAGFCERVYKWASGESLDAVLGGEDGGGDFFRNAKQVVDLCRQLAAVTGRAVFTDAADAVDRGIVAYQSV